jgi:hypothetical protein
MFLPLIEPILQDNLRRNLINIVCVAPGLLFRQPLCFIGSQSFVHQVYRQAVTALEAACEAPCFCGNVLLCSVKMAWQSYHECGWLPRRDDMFHFVPVWLSVPGGKRSQRGCHSGDRLAYRDTNPLVPKVECQKGFRCQCVFSRWG